MTKAIALAALVTALAAPVGLVSASENNVEAERTLSDILQDKRLQEAKRAHDLSKRDTTPEEEREKERKEQQDGEKQSSRAILPQLGFSPEKGGNGGVKFTDRDIGGLTIDVDTIAAQKGQLRAKASVVAPDAFGGRVIVALMADAETDPSKPFFGLGNNDVGSDELSTHRTNRTYARLVGAYRLNSWFSLVGSGAFNQQDIGRGRRLKRFPKTPDAFPGLVGTHGGRTSPISIALLFDDRDDVTRPIQGFNAILKVERIDRALGNEFRFNRATAEASYLHPFPTRRQVLGVRLGGEYVDGGRRDVPFWEYSSLGGGDDLRGYFNDRFLGKAKVIFGGEYRLKVLDFNFFHVWDVKIDGVAFADVGRVFLSPKDLQAAFRMPPNQLPKLRDAPRLSYGPGVRFALGEAIIARVDVGFSEDEVGLVYLVFGHTF